MKRLILAGLAAAVASVLAIGPANAADKTIAFVVNGSSDFWTIANKGTDKAVSELKGYSVEFKIPGQSSAAEQRRISRTCWPAASPASASARSTRTTRPSC